MEVAPRYWQSPDTLKQIYVSTAGGGASGTETTNAVVGTAQAATTARPAAPRTAREHRQQFGAQRGDQCAGQHRQGQRVVRRRGQHQPGDDGAAGGIHHYGRATRRWRSIIKGRSCATTISFNLAPG
jgi:multidrug efflux pump